MHFLPEPCSFRVLSSNSGGQVASVIIKIVGFASNSLVFQQANCSSSTKLLHDQPSSCPCYCDSNGTVSSVPPAATDLVVLNTQNALLVPWCQIINSQFITIRHRTMPPDPATVLVNSRYSKHKLAHLIFHQLPASSLILNRHHPCSQLYIHLSHWPQMS